MSAPGLAACEFPPSRGLGVRSAILIAALPVWNSEVVDKMAPFEGNKALGKRRVIEFDLLKLTTPNVDNECSGKEATRPRASCEEGRQQGRYSGTGRGSAWSRRQAQ